ncbi:MAG: DUF493 family protein [Flavobacteriaceae bacterium]
MLPKENSEDFYSRFHEQLLVSQDWPGNYLFKFIVRSGEDSQSALVALFNHLETKITHKASSKKTYVSISVLVKMHNPMEVINLYKAANKIKGVITL